MLHLDTLQNIIVESKTEADVDGHALAENIIGRVHQRKLPSGSDGYVRRGMPSKADAGPVNTVAVDVAGADVADVRGVDIKRYPIGVAEVVQTVEFDQRIDVFPQLVAEVQIPQQAMHCGMVVHGDAPGHGRHEIELVPPVSLGQERAKLLALAL